MGAPDKWSFLIDLYSRGLSFSYLQYGRISFLILCVYIIYEKSGEGVNISLYKGDKELYSKSF